MMFKTAYSAMFQHIAPNETLCQQVLGAMQAEEAKQMPTIVPVKRSKSRRQVWTLVACAAMVLVAVTLTMTLMKDDKPPVLPAVVTTTVTESTKLNTTTMSDTTGAPTTTVEDEIISPLTTDTSVVEPSTTVATTTSTTQTQTTTIRNTPPASTTTTTMNTLPPVRDYDELFQWIESFTTEAPSKDSLSPTAAPTTANPTTVSPDRTTIDSPETDSTTSGPGFEGAPPVTTTASAMTTRPGGSNTTPDDTCPTAAPTQSTKPFCGSPSYKEERTSNVAQMSDKVLGYLDNNTVLLAPLDSAKTEWLSSTTPPLSANMTVERFCLYGDRMAIICKTGYYVAANDERTCVFLYDISDPTSPRLLKTFGQDGMFFAAHRVGDVLYIASYYTLSSGVDSEDLASFAPRLYDGSTTIFMSPQQISVANRLTGNAYTVLTALSLSGNDTRLSATALYGQSNGKLWFNDTEVLISSAVYSNNNEHLCDLVKLSLTESQRFSNSFCTVSNHIELTHTTDKHHYVLTARHTNTTSSYFLLVLDRNMHIVGRLENCWQNIHCDFRFGDDALYAFNSSRLYTINLQNPTAPRKHLALNLYTDLRWSLELLEPLENGQVLAGYYDVENGGSMNLAILDEEWQVREQAVSSSGWLLCPPQNGLLFYEDGVFAYGVDTGIIKIANMEFDTACEVFLYTDHTLYGIVQNDIFVYDRRNNYRFIGKLQK